MALEREAVALAKELAALEARVGRGEFDRQRTKVLHLKLNPTAEATQEAAEQDRNRVAADNAALRSQVGFLGDAESSLGDAKSSLGDAESSLGVTLSASYSYRMLAGTQAADGSAVCHAAVRDAVGALSSSRPYQGTVSPGGHSTQ